jgi:snurportin-1
LQDTADISEKSTSRRARKAGRMRKYYAHLLMTFEWLIEVPQTLGPAWRVMARPAGKRCLMIASRRAPPAI